MTAVASPFGSGSEGPSNRESRQGILPIERRAQIDGLRALAMIGVVYVHLWNPQKTFEFVRVSLFFVVSGFLITAILLAARDRGGRISVMNFYIRRCLRLLPAVLLVTAISWAYDIDGFRELAPWHLLQASNIYFAWSKDFEPWTLAHLWSLNVLEQFYLLWPPVILLLSKARIHLVTLAAFAGLVIVRVNGAALGLDRWWSSYVFAGDPIATGAFFCLLMRIQGAREVILSPGAIAASLVAVTSPALLGDAWGASESYRLLLQPALATLVCGAFVGWRGPAGHLLQSRPAVFLSKISYGVYMYHLTVWWALGETWPSLYPRGPVTFAVVLAASIAAAWLSWVVLEEPVARLKRYFPTSGCSNSRRSLPREEQVALDKLGP